MKTCPSCGGIIGLECFNPDECAEITLAMQADQDRRVQDLEAHCITLEARLQEITHQTRKES